MTLDENAETFVIHLATLLAQLINPSRHPSLELLSVAEALTKIRLEYSHHIDVLSSNLTMELLEYIRTNNRATELQEGN